MEKIGNSGNSFEICEINSTNYVKFPGIQEILQLTCVGIKIVA